MTACRDVDACMQQFTCKHARTHTLTLSVTVNTLIIDSSFLFFGLLFNGLCFSSTFKSRNHCSHFHIKIPPPRDTLLCGGWWLGSCLRVPIHTNANPNTHLMSLTPCVDTRTALHATGCHYARAHSDIHMLIQFGILERPKPAHTCETSKMVPGSAPGNTLTETAHVRL